VQCGCAKWKARVIINWLLILISPTEEAGEDGGSFWRTGGHAGKRAGGRDG